MLNRRTPATTTCWLTDHAAPMVRVGMEHRQTMFHGCKRECLLGRERGLVRMHALMLCLFAFMQEPRQLLVQACCFLLLRVFLLTPPCTAGR